MRTTLLLARQPVWNTAEPGAGSPGSEASPAVEPPVTEPAATPAPDLSFIPEEFHVDGQPDLGKFTEHYQSIVAERAQAAEATTNIPEGPDGYEIAVPEGIDYGDLTLPSDFKPELNPDDPAFADLKSWLHEAKVPKEAASGLMGVYAKMQARQAAEQLAWQGEQIKALGGQQTFTARINTLGTALKNKLGDDLATEIMSATYSAAQVRALEKLLGSGSSATPRSEPAKAEIDPNLPASERLRMLREAGR